MNVHVGRLVSIQVERSGQTHFLAVGEGLHVNDLFVLTVQLNEPRYLYVARISLQGMRVLFPSEGTPMLQAPDAAIRIPASGPWMRCEKLQENEKLCLIIAKKRLDLDGGEDGSRDDEKTTGSEEKDENNRTGFEQMIEIPVSR